MGGGTGRGGPRSRPVCDHLDAGIEPRRAGSGSAVEPSSRRVPDCGGDDHYYVFAPAVGVPVVLLLGLFLMARKAPVNAIAVMTVASLGWVASEVFKIIIARPRPDQSQLFDPLSPETGSNSFPSGHAAFAVALAFAVYFLARGSRWARTAAIVGALVAVIVAWSRVYVGVHYPSDVIASFFASTAAVILFAGLWNRYAARILIRVPWLTRIGPVPRTSTSV